MQLSQLTREEHEEIKQCVKRVLADLTTLGNILAFYPEGADSVRKVQKLVLAELVPPLERAYFRFQALA